MEVVELNESFPKPLRKRKSIENCKSYGRISEWCFFLPNSDLMHHLPHLPCCQNCPQRTGVLSTQYSCTIYHFSQVAIIALKMWYDWIPDPMLYLPHLPCCQNCPYRSGVLSTQYSCTIYHFSPCCYHGVQTVAWLDPRPHAPSTTPPML